MNNLSGLHRHTFTASLLAILLLIFSGTALCQVGISFGSAGLSSLKYNGTDFLLYGDFRLNQVTFSNPNGSPFAGNTASTVTVDPIAQTQTRTYAWGKIVVGYTSVGNQLKLGVVVTNTSSQPIQQIWFEPLGLRFPSSVTNYDGSDPIIFDTLGQPAIAVLQSASASVAVAADDVAKPLQLGFPYAFDRPANTQFPVDLNTGTVSSYPNSFPVINRSIPAGGSDQFRFSLRFGPGGSTATTLASDVYRNFAATYPSTINWTDRRAIGQLILATSAAGYPTNPRGWFLDPTVDVTTPAGVSSFQQRVLAYANNSIGILKQMNAQGMITWDIEGEQFAQPTSYIGDPRVVATLAPEMASIADQYFQLFRNAGFRVGVCLRPQQLSVGPGATSAQQIPLADPTQTLLDKAAYAHNRWGATLFYIDSNVNATDPNPVDPVAIKTLAAAFPDSLFIPEHSNTQYYAYSGPYRELRQGYTSTPAEARFTYPNALTVIYTPDGPISQNYNALVAAVQAGDILLFRSWFADPQNTQVANIYQAASGKVAPAVSVAVNPSSASLNTGQSQQFTSTVTGSSNAQVTWSISPAGTGSISASGVYSAPQSVVLPISVSVIAISSADPIKSGSAIVNISATATPVSIAITPLQVSLNAGQNQQFSAIVSGSSSTQVTWTIQPAGAGTISAAGLYSAPATVAISQSLSLIATSVTDPTKSATAAINLIATTPVSLTLSPASASLAGGRSQQFSAIVSGTSNTAVTWSTLPAGVGAISATGLYTAPASVSSQQLVTVVASSSADPSKTASATVLLVPAIAAQVCGAPASGAFTGCYYGDRGFSNLAFTRIDPQINFVWSGTGPGSGIGSSQFSVRWQGNFLFGAGTYNFTLATDDGSRLLIDGQTVIDGWGEHPAIPVNASVPLSAGTHLIQVDYFQLDGSASANLIWSIAAGQAPLAVSTAPAGVTLTASQTQQFSATVMGSANQQVIWSALPAGVGTISTTGIYTAPTSIGSPTLVVIVATSVADGSKSATSSISLSPSASPAIAVTVSPQTVSVGSGQMQPFAASVTGTVDSRVVWSLLPINSGSISTSGILTAPTVASPQTISVTATSLADSSKSGSALATITPPASSPTSCGAPATNAFTGCYYSDRSFDPSVFAFSRVDPQISFVWSATGPGGNIGLVNYQVRWQGNFNFPGGNYQFTSATDDGSRLYIDGQLIIDYWGEHPAIPIIKTVPLNSGIHAIQLDYMQLGGGASANLSWLAVP